MNTRHTYIRKDRRTIAAEFQTIDDLNRRLSAGEVLTPEEKRRVQRDAEATRKQRRARS